MISISFMQDPLVKGFLCMAIEKQTTPEVHMTKVNSSDLDDIEYNETTRILTITFKNGSIYEYENVPKQEYLGLMSAASHGRYFAQNIKFQYHYRRIG